MSEKMDKEVSKELMESLKGLDVSLVEEIRDMMPQKILTENLGKATSKSLLREIFSPRVRMDLQTKFRRLCINLLKQGAIEMNKKEELRADLHLNPQERLLELLESLRRDTLELANLSFSNLLWPPPEMSLVIDHLPAEVDRSSWSFEVLPQEWSLSGLAGKIPDKGSYLVTRPASAPEHKVPDIVQRITSAARNLALFGHIFNIFGHSI